MEIRNLIRYVSPLGFIVRMYVTEFDIQKLIRFGIIRPWDYHIVLYGYPLIQEFVYDVSNVRYGYYLLSLFNKSVL